MREERSNTIGILWFRQDLRLHDNEALTDALSRADYVYPVYVFDERTFKGKTEFGFSKTGGHRARFIRESVEELRNNLRSLGADLIIRHGLPEVELFELAHQLKADWIFCNRERTAEEVYVQDELEKRLWSIGAELRYNRGKMLYYTQDLPFPITHTPDMFTQFRKEVEKLVHVRQPLPVPTFIPWNPPDLDLGKVPAKSWFSKQETCDPTKHFFQYKGGEKAGLDRLRYYFGEKQLASDYKDTRNQMMGADFSTRFSAWLSAGCLSPKTVFHELKAYESCHGESESTYHIFYELLWRDYFRLVGKKYGNRIFQANGIKGTSSGEKIDSANNDLFQKWARGQTGTPIIDANMRELLYTGYMSNRGRQLTASYLIKDLGFNWQVGASWFESMLIDYDPCSNWGNWMYLAGVGNNPRDDRYYNVLSQARKFDPQGEYCRHWLSELSGVACDKIHMPDQLTPEECRACGLADKAHFREPLVPSERWIR